MQSCAKNGNSPADYSFPWSMAEEEEIRATGPANKVAEGACGVLEVRGPADAVPMAFRSWLLEHGDELIER